MSLGITLNNPFDLEKTDTLWKGEIRPGSNPRFCQFDTMANGIRAGAIDIVHMNLLHNDLKTLEAMATHYAPPNENDTAEYINVLCDRTGYQADAPLDLSKEDEARNVALAFMDAEQGAEVHRIGQTDIDVGIAAAFQALKLAGKMT